jgi:hypothetical protein
MHYFTDLSDLRILYKIVNLMFFHSCLLRASPVDDVFEPFRTFHSIYSRLYLLLEIHLICFKIHFKIYVIWL